MAAINEFNGAGKSWDAPPTRFEVVVPHASNDFAYVCRAIYVGATGDVAAVSATDGLPYVHVAVPAGSYIVGLFRRVNAIGTSASSMLAVS